MREKLEKMLAEGRDSALLRFGLGDACLKENDAEQAAVHLAHATVQQPGYSAAWKLLGKALQQLGRPDEAEAAWTTGLAVARKQGDLQAVKEMTVFVNRLHKAAPGQPAP
ncbi:Tetratricopeptide repeat-containing protein [Janthinobacterium sp. TND4EL3]|uniref:tetratricopeptide repeat protein n=1 Tax=Janthinobacterium sp. TND4EL3 TaxID=1907311 RepID=UPI0009559CD9|nr:tetratricopeptide repeat protein [Janthinobacterium sp. TND4EL3]SIR50496.1 Tetratricopeptide repeat-containing protein [Janthinobacterium sp. TND4EL3]